MSLLRGRLGRLVGRLGRPLRALVALALLLAALSVLSWYHGAILHLNAEGPAYERLEKLTVTLAPGEDITLGRAELMQPKGSQSAALDHFELSADAAGNGVTIRRVTDQRRLSLRFPDGKQNGGSNRVAIVQRGADPRAQDRTVLRLPEYVVEIHLTDAAAPDMVVEVFAAAAGQPGVKGALQKRYLVENTGRVIDDAGAPVAGCIAREDLGATDRVARMISGFKRTNAAWFNEKYGVIMLGGPDTCVLGNGTTLLGLPDADELLEFGVDWHLGTDLAFVSARSSVGNVPVRFEQVTEGQLASEVFGTRGFAWPLLTGAAEQFPNHVNGFFAGRTRHKIAAAKTTAGDWQITVSVGPHDNAALIDTSRCGPGSDLGLDDCPATRDPARAQVVTAPAPPPLVRMYRAVTTDHLSAEEQLFWATLMGIGLVVAVLAAMREMVQMPRLGGPLVMALRALPWGAEDRGSGRDTWTAMNLVVPRVLLGLAVVLALAPLYLPPLLGAVMGGSPPDAVDLSTARLLLTANLALFAVASIMIWIERDGGLILSLYWVLLVALVLLGAVSMFALSAEGNNTNWERHFVKHALFSLNLLPFYATIAATISAPALRERLGSEMVGRRGFRSVFFWVMTITLILFLAWLFVGGQEGVAGIQPVELGKYIVMLGLGSFLAQRLIRARRLSEVWSGLAGVSAAVIVVLIVALMVVPVVRSDYSPVIIILMAGGIVVTVMGISTGIRVAQEREEDNAKLRRLPVRFRPPTRRLRGLTSRALARLHDVLPQRLHGKLSVWPWVFLAAMIFPTVFMARDFIVQNPPLSVAEWSWTAPIEEQRTTLEDALGEGRRLIKERLMIWVDMRYPDDDGQDAAQEDTALAEATPPARPRIQLRDLDLQVLRSRVVIGHAQCGLDTGVTPALFAPDDTRPDAAAERACNRVPGALPGACTLESLGICEVRPLETRLLPDTNCLNSDLKMPVVPHCVPVVESDFAATFLIGRFGLGAGVTLIAIQALVLIIGFGAGVWLLRDSSRDPIVSGAHQAMAGVVIGAASLYTMQWVLAWSNALGLLPVMGQPMTWLSVGTSHHIFMAVPAALSILIGLRIAGSRPNTVPFRWMPYY